MMNKHFFIGLDGNMYSMVRVDPPVNPPTPTPTATPPPAPKAKFKPGDVVTLNSGSPDMTVVDETNGEVRVIYFPETDTAAYASESQHACFPAVCLSAIPTEAMN